MDVVTAATPHRIDRAESQKMCLFKGVEAFFVNLYYTTFLGVLKGAESEFAV